MRHAAPAVRFLCGNLCQAPDQQRAQRSIPVPSTAPGNDPHSLGGLRRGDEAPVERLVETQHATRQEPPGAGTAESPFALQEQGPREPAGRFEPAELPPTELAVADEGRRRTDVDQPSGSRESEVRGVRERECQGAQLPPPRRSAEVTDRLTDGGKSRVHAAGRVGPRLPHDCSHQGDEADVAPTRRHPGPASAARRRRLIVLDHAQHRHLAAPHRGSTAGEIRLPGRLRITDRLPPTAYRMEQFILSAGRTCPAFQRVDHCQGF